MIENVGDVAVRLNGTCMFPFINNLNSSNFAFLPHKNKNRILLEFFGKNKFESLEVVMSEV